MGKRELLLIAAFLVVGAIAYRITTPADASGAGFSVGRLIEAVRSHLRGQNYELQATRTATAPAPPALTTLLLEDLRGTIVVAGEDRDDIAAELQATVFGADEAQARQFEHGVTMNLEPDEEGKVLAVRLGIAIGEMRRRPRTRLTVKVPKRLALRLASNGELEIAHVASVEFERGTGKAMLTAVAGAVTGEFGPGALEIDRAGSIELETRRTEVRVTEIAGHVKIEAQSGDLRLRGSGGPTDLTIHRISAEVEDAAGPLTVEGTGGELRVRNVRAPATIKVERMEVGVVLSAPVPVNASTTGDTLDVTLPAGGLTLEAVSHGGQIRVIDSAIPVSVDGDAQHAVAKLRGGGPLVKLESSRGDIVIR